MFDSLIHKNSLLALTVQKNVKQPQMMLRKPQKQKEGDVNRRMNGEKEKAERYVDPYTLVTKTVV